MIGRIRNLHFVFLIIVGYPNHEQKYVTAKNISVIHPLGSNSNCDGNVRIRRDWDLISRDEKEIFLQAVERAIDEGIYQRFIHYHADLVSAIQSHETCAFILWHRRYLLAMENMLRSLDTKFSCLTIPYWNIMEHYRDQERGFCDSFASCSRVVSDIGGIPLDFDEDRTFSQISANGQLFSGRPIQNLKDDFGKIGIVRGDLLDIEIPQSCSYREVFDILTTSTSHTDFARRIQTGLHDDVHDFIGGMMPTFASPSDPLFLVWHSFIDLLLFLWEVCNVEKTDLNPTVPFDPFGNTQTSCSYTQRAKNTFPITINATDLYMKSGGQDSIRQDIRDDPLIGKYFLDIGLSISEVSSIWKLNEDEFTYDHLTAPMWNLLQDQTACPANQWLTNSPTSSPISIGPTTGPDLTLFEQWVKDLRNDLITVHEDDLEMVDAKISFLLCTLSGSREIPSDTFREDLLDGTVSNPKCNFFLKVETGSDTSPAKVADNVPSPSSTFVSRTIVVDWFIPNEEDLEDFAFRRAKVGDTIVFEWSGFHNVFIHPSGSCLVEGSVLIGSESGKTSYMFTEDDVGVVVFACDIGGHCEAGQLIEVTVTMPNANIKSSSPTMIGSSSSDVTSSSHRNSFFISPILLLFLFIVPT